MLARQVLSKRAAIEALTIRRPQIIGLMMTPTNNITIRNFAALRKTVGSGRRKPSPRKDMVAASNGAIPPAPSTPDDPWVSVLDRASGQTYWWNQSTNETTALGAPRPQDGAVGPVQPGQRGSMMGGLAGVVAEGMAFGVGSAIAHRAVGAVASSMFGGGSDSGDGGGSGGDEGWDI